MFKFFRERRKTLVFILPLSLACGIHAAWSAQFNFFNSTIRQSSRKAAQDCAGQVAVGTTVPVQYTWKQVCNKAPDESHPEFMGDSTDFTLSREPDRPFQNADGSAGQEHRISATATILLDIRSPEELA